jgi:tetratricopeptide (TPR) repeat protein
LELLKLESRLFLVSQEIALEKLEKATNLIHYDNRLKSDDDAMTEDERSRVLEKIADCLSSFSAFEPAVKYYKLAVEAAESSGASQKRLASLYNSVAATYYDLSKYGDCVEYYEKGKCSRCHIWNMDKTMIDS